MESRGARISLGVWVALVLAFLYVPIGIICLYAFNQSNVQSWPIPGLTMKWFGPAIHNGDMQQALWLSLKAAALATSLLCLSNAAQFDQCITPRLFGGHAATDISLDVQSQMRIQFGGNLGITRSAPKEFSKP